MQNENIKKKLEDTIWVAKSLFDRGKVSGSTANISFRYMDNIYISATGSCFGNLSKETFSVVNLDGRVLSEVRPSKEIELHKSLYETDDSIRAVIHTHSTYVTYWSCILEEAKNISIPTPTPYLDMKIGQVGWVSYYKPGSEELFKNFANACSNGYKAYLLENHGVIVGGESILDAFYMLEEIEEASKNAWLLQLNMLLNKRK